MNNILSLILFLPLAGALLVALLPGKNKQLVRWTALLVSLVPFILTLVLWTEFGGAEANADGYKFVVNVSWYEAINSSFHIGIDGLSLTMVLLTTLLTPLAILASFSIEDRVKGFMALFLGLEMGMLGVFMSLDLLLFFVFWEIEIGRAHV